LLTRKERDDSKFTKIKMEVERTGNYQMKDVNNNVFLSIHPPPSYGHIVLANETDKVTKGLFWM
jgi:hypothetical protein